MLADAVSRKIFGKRECQRFHALLARGRKIAKVKIEVQSDGKAGSDWRRAAGQKKGYRLLSFGSVDKLNCLFVSL